MSFISHAANQLTQPFGLKLFGGSDYPDRGLGDAAMNASKPLQTAGTTLLNNGMAALPNLWSQFAGATGVANPYASTSPNDTGGVGGPNILGAPTTAASMELTGPYLTAYNNAASKVNARRKAALEAAQAGLSARGLSNSGAKALLQHINKLHDDELNDEYTKATGSAHAEKVNALASLLSGAQGNVAQGAGLISGNVGVLQNQAQAAEQRTNQANQALGGALGAAFGFGTPVRTAATTQTTGQGGGAGSPSFVGPLQPFNTQAALGGWTPGSPMGNDTSIGGRAAQPKTMWNWGG